MKYLLIAGLVATLTVGAQANAQPSEGEGANGNSSIKRPDGHILTFYGLRKLEHDTAVSEEEKLREWEAYIERAKQNIEYAKTAVERWKKAARARVIEGVQKDDHDPKLRPSEKMERWKRIVSLYPRSKEASLAQKRIAFWRSIETKLLVEAAEEVERERGSKVERIRAWSKVSDWVGRGPEQRAAIKRITALQSQLFAEAKSIDKIARVDSATKLASWRDVLAGAPTPPQQRLAEERVKELSMKVDGARPR